MTRSGNTYTIGFKKLVEKGSGAVSDNALNGGYKKVNGGYLFVDNATDKTGIFYMESKAKAVAFTRDGEFYYVNINYGRDENGNITNDLSKATLMYGPQMAQATDKNNKPIYSVFYFEYLDPKDDSRKTFKSDGKDAEYQRILAKLQAADEEIRKAN